jgi:pimeloyl-ACP methyl ester carboxylesterase
VAGFHDNRDDAAAALRALTARPDIRADAIGVVGHSEGAVHAMWLGAHADVRAVVLLAGFARVGEDALRWQANMIARDIPTPLRPFLRRMALRQLARIKTTTTDVTRIAGMRVNARWIREVLSHDPRPHLAAIHVPVFAITGDKDIQVDPADLEQIRRLVPGKAEIRRMPDLTHVLRRTPDRASLRSYPRLLRQPVDADLLTDMTNWLAQHLQ